MRVRRLSALDVMVWRQIRLRALATDPAAFSARHDDWITRPISDFESDIATSEIFVAEDETGLLGCARLSPDKNAANGKTGWVTGVFVAPEARGRGVGVALMNALRDAARAQGKTELFLDVAKSNLAARALYTRVSFKEVSADQRPPGSNSGCELSMQLAF